MIYRNILLIDDDEEDHEIFEMALSSLPKDFIFNALTNAKEALDQLVNGELKPDVIFLDLNMPVMSGQEFLTEVKQKAVVQHIPVIIFSTSSQPSAMKLTKELGAMDFIIKPGRFDKLVDLLKSILN